MKLSDRLECIISLVPKHKVVIDVGTDHAYLPIELVDRGISKHVIASDIGEGPISQAKANVKAAGYEDEIECRLGDGLNGVDPDSVDVVVVAGMGGELISKILSNADEGYHGSKTLVLSPQSEPGKVRHLLHQMKYAIEKDCFLVEDGKYYTVIKAIPGNEKYDREAFYDYGVIPLVEGNTVLLEFLQNKLVTYMMARNRVVKARSFGRVKEKAKLESQHETQNNLQEQIDEVQELIATYYR